MPSPLEILQYFLKAWADVALNLLWRTHKKPELQDWPASDYQFMVVFLSLAFFYMVCYLLHKWGEDLIKLRQLRRKNAKFLIDHNYNDSST